MLKYFYKTILTSILCGSLLLLNFSLDGKVSLNSARAETVKTDGIGDGDLMSTLAMTSIGLIASRLYTYKQTTDTMLAAAGGAAFIAGEILAYFKLKKVMKDMETQITRDEKGKIDQKQIETLEKLKQSYVEAKGTANTKKNLQMAAAAAFAAAAVAAIVLKSSESIAFQGCSAVLTAAGTACPFSAGAATGASGSLTALQTSREVPGPSMSTKATETTGLATFTASLTTLSTSLGASASQYSSICSLPYGAGLWACPYIGACTSAAASIQSCQSITPTCQMTGAYGIIGTIASNHPILPKQMLYAEVKQKNSFANLLNFFMAEAKADLLSPMGIASSFAIKYVLATYASVGATIDNFLFTPMKRGIAWGIMSAMTMAASSATSAQIGKIESNIQKIDAILNAMYAHQNGVETRNTPNVQNQKIDKTIANNKALGFNDAEVTDVDLKAHGTSLPCITGENEKKCPSFSNQIKSLPDFSAMPDSVQDQISSVSKMADGINGVSKISSSTVADINALSAQSKAISDDLARREKELQAKLKASGSTIDIAKEKAELKGSIMNAIQKELDRNKMTAKDMLASFGSGSGGFGKMNSATDASNAIAGSEGKDKDGKDGNGKGSKQGAAATGPIAVIPAATLPKIEDKALSKALDADLASGEKTELASNVAGKDGEANTIDSFDLKNDITKEKETSIFELISNRYQKSGYPRLFKRIK